MGNQILNWNKDKQIHKLRKKHAEAKHIAQKTKEAQNVNELSSL